LGRFGGDFDLALRGLLGDDAPLSKPTIRRLKAVWAEEFAPWNRRSLEGTVNLSLTWPDFTDEDDFEQVSRPPVPS